MPSDQRKCDVFYYAKSLISNKCKKEKKNTGLGKISSLGIRS